MRTLGGEWVEEVNGEKSFVSIYKMLETDDRLKQLIQQYKKSRRPLSVDFRKMVTGLKPDRFTHLIHPYPAKLLMHIPHFFLSNNLLSSPDDTVLDPFCGSGTVLLESQLSGRKAIGADSNPMARLISKVKTSLTPESKLRNAFLRIVDRIPYTPTTKLPDVINIKHWFYPHVIKQLHCIIEAIMTLRKPHYRDFFLVCFSNCVRKVSLADPRLNVPVRLRQGQYPDGHCLREKTDAHIRSLRRINVLNVFRDVTLNNLQRVALLNNIRSNEQPQIICEDARNLIYKYTNNGHYGKFVPDESVQIVITSPPYAGAQKYVRSMSLSLGWLGMCSSNELRTYKIATIGREEYKKHEYTQPLVTGIGDADRVLKRIQSVNLLRSHIAANYLVEMKEALSEIVRVLKPEGYLVLVAANNRICGHNFKTVTYLRIIGEQLGLSLKLCLIDHIRSRGLMTKRNRTSGMITREWVMLFEKG